MLYRSKKPLIIYGLAKLFIILSRLTIPNVLKMNFYPLQTALPLYFSLIASVQENNDNLQKIDVIDRIHRDLC
ncbi:hypothetical protein PtVF89_11465 [Legionella pneumophila]|nr:hypothetical protein BIZ52_07710 [Legionella pneumophila subsp. fraseri]APF06283.1 hypothetical protein BIZ51_07825 [Legionella pneumophila subsp. fraseri]KXB24673.1 hypothetical protein PtVF89_11465 [Legionella pneumophila]